MIIEMDFVEAWKTRALRHVVVDTIFTDIVTLIDRLVAFKALKLKSSGSLSRTGRCKNAL